MAGHTTFGERKHSRQIGSIVEKYGRPQAPFVGALVLAQVILAPEALVAPAARVRPNATVNAAVTGQLLVAGERLLTTLIVAHKGTFTWVCVCVRVRGAKVKGASKKGWKVKGQSCQCK